MKPTFVKTANVKRLMLGLQAVEQRGAGEACLMVVDGLPGLGKTSATRWLAAQNDCVFIRAKKEWTPNWMLNDLLKQLQEKLPAHSFEKKFEQALTALAKRADAAMRNGDMFAVIIDEVDYISRSDKMLSTVRDLSDMLEIPFILVGMGRVRSNLTRFPQVARRVSQWVEFLHLDAGDVTDMVTGLCDYTVREDLIQQIVVHSKGYVSEIKEAVAGIERFAARQDCVTEIGVSEMAGQVLLNDRATSQPIKVKG